MTSPSPVAELRVVITSPDFHAAVRFWRDVLGLPLLHAFDGPGGGGILLDAGRATIEIVAPEQAAAIDIVETGRPGRGGKVRLALEVGDSRELSARLAAAGAKRLGSVVDTPWGHRNVRLETPDGVQLTLFKVLSPGDQAG
jgi:lactoylglutathione lyase